MSFILYFKLWRNKNSLLFRLKVTGGDGSSCDGSVQYGTEYRLVTSAGDLTLTVDTGSVEATPWDIATVTTRLHVEPVV